MWDAAGEFVNGNILTVYIKCLREKIEDDLANPHCFISSEAWMCRRVGRYIWMARMSMR